MENSYLITQNNIKIVTNPISLVAVNEKDISNQIGPAEFSLTEFRLHSCTPKQLSLSPASWRSDYRSGNSRAVRVGWRRYFRSATSRVSPPCSLHWNTATRSGTGELARVPTPDFGGPWSSRDSECPAEESRRRRSLGFSGAGSSSPEERRSRTPAKQLRSDTPLFYSESKNLYF